MTPPTRPQLPLVDDGYLVELEPTEPSPGSARWVARQPGYLSKRRGCSWLGFLVIAIAFLIATPRPAQPIVSADRLPSATTEAERTGAPERASIGGRATETDGLALLAGGGFRPSVGAPTSIPAPTAEIGTALYSASATWCAPTPTQCLRWGGHALLAALPTFTGVPYVVRVWRGTKHVDVTVVSWCSGCGIDVSPWAFQQLAPLKIGRIAVQIEGPIAQEDDR